MTLQEARELAATNHQAGRLADAEALYRQILAQAPEDAATYNSLAILYSQAGQNQHALPLVQRAAALEPGSAMYQCNAGLILARLGRTDDAIGFYRRALELSPQHPPTLNNLGLALGVKGKFEEALECFQIALSVRPDFVEARCSLAQGQYALRQWEKAIESFGLVLQARPQHAESWNDLGAALRMVGRLDESIAAYEQATLLQPGQATFHFNLGNVLQQQGKIERAITAFTRAVALAPEVANHHNNLGHAYYFNGEWEKAEVCFRQAISLKPDFDMAYNNLGSLLKDFGQIDEAIENFEKSLALDPECAPHHSNLVYAMHFNPACDAQALLREQRRWNDRHGAALFKQISPHGNDRDPKRRLRIGYVSPDFRDHVIGKNLLPLIQNHDRQRFEIFCYSRVPSPDGMTEKFRGASDQWRNILNQTFNNTAKQISEDKIDILVDLGLHLAGNCLPVFARKPAPIQVTFGGYPAGTGLEAMDYRLTDPWLDPPGKCDDQYVEKSVRLADTFWCYDPAAMGVSDGPEVNALPALHNGFCTFGCLNNFSKINDLVLALWAQVLVEMPTARLVLLTPAGAVRKRTATKLADLGVARTRVELVDRQSPLEYFKLYHRIDIGLDTLPYNGHTTSLDSLWMGVPVITLIGKTSVGRAGWSQLCNLKLAELAARSPEEFVSVAMKLAGDLPRLAELRAGLRHRMLQSPLCDAGKFARSIETAYRQMWRTWTGSEGGEGTGDDA